MKNMCNEYWEIVVKDLYETLPEYFGEDLNENDRNRMYTECAVDLLNDDALWSVIDSTVSSTIKGWIKNK